MSREVSLHVYTSVAAKCAIIAVALFFALMPVFVSSAQLYWGENNVPMERIALHVVDDIMFVALGFMISSAFEAFDVMQDVLRDNQPFPTFGMSFTTVSCLSGILCLGFLMSYFSVQTDFVSDAQRSIPFLPWMFLAVSSTVGGAVVSQLSFTYRRARRYYQQQSVV